VAPRDCQATRDGGGGQRRLRQDTKMPSRKTTALTKRVVVVKSLNFEDERRPRLAAARERRLPISTHPPNLRPIPLDTAPLHDALGVLVVDDDDLLLNLIARVLKGCGFLVWTASSGAEAINVYQQHRQEIDVVLLDVRMPGQDGPTTLARLRQINPSLCCCFMTGHSGDYTPDDLRAFGARCCFDKPFRLEDVAQTLRQLAQAS
jgi:CheY-like chemotaxis protein